jgi:hypothetical protein
MTRKKLKVKKFFKGAEADAKAGKAAMSPNTSVTGQVRSPQGPVDPGIATESITSFKDNFRARQRAQGAANVIPGSTIFNAIGAARDTLVGRKAMNMSPTKTAVQKLQTVGAQDNQSVTCPPGFINVNGTCVKQASKGGLMKYYKGLL